MHGVRREALRCIPDAVRRNLEERSWVTWLTWTRKREGTRACRESGGRLEASRAACRETRAIGLAPRRRSRGTSSLHVSSAT